MSVFFVILFIFSTLLLSLSPWYSARVEAAKNEIPALITEKQKQTKLEGGTQGVLEKFDASINDPAKGS